VIFVFKEADASIEVLNTFKTIASSKKYLAFVFLTRTHICEIDVLLLFKQK